MFFPEEKMTIYCSMIERYKCSIIEHIYERQSRFP